MKKIVLVALMALCGVSFSFGDDCLNECQSDVVIKCVQGNCIPLNYSNIKYSACCDECIAKYSSPDTINYCNAKCKK